MKASACIRKIIYNLVLKNISVTILVLLKNIGGKKMRLNLNKLFVLFVVLAVFASLSAIAAADVSDNGSVSAHGTNFHPHHPVAKNKVLTMTARYNAGTGYHWEISPKTHGVTLMTTNYIQHHPGTTGSSGTVVYKFLVQNKKHYYVKLVLVDPRGNVVDEKHIGK